MWLRLRIIAQLWLNERGFFALLRVLIRIGTRHLQEATLPLGIFALVLANLGRVQRAQLVQLENDK